MSPMIASSPESPPPMIIFQTPSKSSLSNQVSSNKNVNNFGISGEDIKSTNQRD